MIIWELNSLVRLISHFNGRRTVFSNVENICRIVFIILFIDITGVNGKRKHHYSFKNFT